MGGAGAVRRLRRCPLRQRTRNQRENTYGYYRIVYRPPRMLPGRCSDMKSTGPDWRRRRAVAQPTVLMMEGRNGYEHASNR
jgi:hypothetical protein